ncbi:glucuronate isomerase [Caldicellulosiruptoraceae bacterium PP1]
MIITDRNSLKDIVYKTINNTEIIDIHTHLYAPSFKGLLLWGIDELLTYHYLIAETFRHINMPYNEFWNLSKSKQAEIVWDTLFIKNSPYSEACVGVLTTLKKLGLDTKNKDLQYYRNFFSKLTVNEYVDIVLEISNVKQLVMTNDPFDNIERLIWQKNPEHDKRFKAALRLDSLLNNWENIYIILQQWGYNVEAELTERTISEIKKFLLDWVKRMDALYMAASLPDTFNMPENTNRSRIIEECIIPVCSELNIPFAMMIGVKRSVNPELRLAGDSVGKACINSIEYLCSKYPKNKFMVTMLSRENQYELNVTARKFRNLLIFGCWWFLNNPTTIQEMTSMRLEMLGTSVIPQHSDARVLDQLIYKWEHSKKIIANVLYNRYSDLYDTGWEITEEDIRRDINKLFSDNFTNFLELKL